MNTRFPLYAQILLWFFTNLLVLAAAFFVLLRAQFHSGFDWLLAAGAGQRLQALSDVITADLGQQPQPEWGDVLKRFEEAYRLRFHLLDNLNGKAIAGESVELPPQVRALIPGYRGVRTRPSRSQDLPVVRQGENTKFIVRTSGPTRYWALVRVAIRGPESPQPTLATLAIVSTSLSAGGLFFDVKPWLVLGLGAVVLSALLWLPFVRLLTQSVRQMTQATGRIAEGRFDQRVKSHRRDELGALAHSVNSMAERLAGFVSGQKRFLGDIAHELCAPLARIQLALGILEQRTGDKNKDSVQDLREEVEHMSSLVNELLSFSRASLGSAKIELQPVRLLRVAEEAAKREADGNDQIRLEVPSDLYALAEPDLLVRALSNLLRNSLRYAGQAGPITVSAQKEGRQVLLIVTDCGPGVPEAELARIFDPFYRVDPSRNAATGGGGLGLAIVKTCIEVCQGSVHCENRSPSGLETTISLLACEITGTE